MITIKQYITCFDIADYFIAFSNVTNISITNLKLQKLVYYAQAWHLALYNRPLFQGYFQAWAHGPLLPKLYYQYRQFRWQPIQRPDLNEESLDKLEQKLGNRLIDFLEDIISKYFGLTAHELEALTHSEEPWKTARAGLSKTKASDNFIKNKDMIDYYKQIAQNGNCL